MKNRPIKLLMITDDADSFSSVQAIISQEKERAVELARARDISEAVVDLEAGKFDACILSSNAPLPELLHKLVQRSFPPLTILARPQSEHESRGGRAELAIRRALEQVKDFDKLQRNELRFWVKFFDDPAGLALLDAHGKIIAFNGTFQRMLGYQEEECRGLSLRKIIHPEDAQENERLYQEILLGEHGQYELENRCICKNGTCIKVKQTALGLFDSRKVSKQYVLLSLEKVLAGEPANEKDGASYPEKSLSSQLLDAHETERKMIAQELHDSLGACLTAIKYVLEKNLEQLQKKRGRAEISLAEVIPLVQGAIEETRRISTSLWPAALDDLGIISTIHSLCSEFQKTYSSISIQKRVDVDEQEIPPPMKAAIYRILQEGFTNVAKHSGATHVKLSLLRKDENVELSLEDNGCGFDYAKIQKGTEGGLGLSSMKSRAEMIGGRFIVETETGAGTRIRAVWRAS